MRILGALVLFAMVACDDSPAEPKVDAALQARIDRGRYLTNHVAQCSFCHTPLLPDGSRDLTRFLAGQPVLFDIDRNDPNAGSMPSPNLTNDPTGIGNYSDDQVVAAIRDGVKLDGSTSGVLQVHPNTIYKNMTEDDVRAIVAYLRSIPAISNAIPARQPPWTVMPERPSIDMSTYPMPSAGGDQDSAMRGRYLVGTAGLCNQCHSVVTAGAFDTTKFLAGGVSLTRGQLYGQLTSFPATIFGANITPDPATGIGNVTLDDIRNVFRKGVDENGDCLCAPTHGSPAAPFAGLTDDDVDDIGHYLLTIPAVSNPTAQPTPCTAPGFCVP